MSLYVHVSLGRAAHVSAEDYVRILAIPDNTSVNVRLATGSHYPLRADICRNTGHDDRRHHAFKIIPDDANRKDVYLKEMVNTENRIKITKQMRNRP